MQIAGKSRRASARARAARQTRDDVITAGERGAVLASTARNTSPLDVEAFGIPIIEARDLEIPMTIAEQDAHRRLTPAVWRHFTREGWRTYNRVRGDNGAR